MYYMIIFSLGFKCESKFEMPILSCFDCFYRSETELKHDRTINSLLGTQFCFILN